MSKRRRQEITVPPAVSTSAGRETMLVEEAKVSPSQKRLNDLLKRLMELCTSAVIKVASSECKDRAKCDIYNKAKEIAKVIDEVTELRGKVEGT